MEEALPPRFDALLRLSQSQKIVTQSDGGKQRSTAQHDQIGAPACTGTFPAWGRPWSMSGGTVLVSTFIDGRSSCVSVLAERDAEVGLTRSGSGLSCEAAVFIF